LLAADFACAVNRDPVKTFILKLLFEATEPAMDINREAASKNCSKKFAYHDYVVQNMVDCKATSFRFYPE
jgi:hypothetical protein